MKILHFKIYFYCEKKNVKKLKCDIFFKHLVKYSHLNRQIQKPDFVQKRSSLQPSPATRRFQFLAGRCLPDNKRKLEYKKQGRTVHRSGILRKKGLLRLKDNFSYKFLFLYLWIYPWKFVTDIYPWKLTLTE